MLINSMKMKFLNRKIKKLLFKAIPLWLAVVLILDSSIGVGIIEYFIMQRNLNNAISSLSQTTKNPDQLIQILKQGVLPQQGYQLGVTWGDIGKQLMATGVIDKQKYDQMFAQDPGNNSMMKYLSNSSHNHMMITEANSHFMVNTLWALGLVNKNDILDNGQMKTYGQGDPMNFASTGGWNLGTKATNELYSSAPLIQLTDKEETLVKEIAANIYRPCCGNSVAFPDCNHGMAVLGYIELAVKQGLSEKRIYQDVLALNSYWFPQQYVTLAAYFNEQKIDWNKVDAKKVLGIDYSSGQAAAKISQAVQNLSGFQSKQGGCGA